MSTAAATAPGPRSIKLAVAALGGQGGGVLTDWLVTIAESAGWLVQATSVPGVAQRTGATLYYLEFFPAERARAAGAEPVLALMPVPGDVDCVLAAELAEAGRAIARGLVTPERTTLIASAHRAYTIAERSAPGDGRADTSALRTLAVGAAQRLILFDMEAIADRHHSVISSVLLGALCGAAVLPFPQAAFEAAIRAGGIAVDTNLRAFEDARTRAARGEIESPVAPAAVLGGVPERARTPALQGLLDRVRSLPAAAQPTALEGVRRTLDYQDPEYAAQYLGRLERLAGAGADAQLLEAAARSLALWMSFEDTIRVADLKTRAVRFERVREEQRVAGDAVYAVTDFMKPRLEEIAGTLPAGLGRRLLAGSGAGRLGWLTRGWRLRTSTLSGFLLLYALAGCRRLRRRTLRFIEENGRIEQWLGELEGLARVHAPLALEWARAQRLIKGYGDTHARGWRAFCALRAQLPRLKARPDGAQVLARMQAAALADEEGAALERAIAALTRGDALESA